MCYTDFEYINRERAKHGLPSVEQVLIEEGLAPKEFDMQFADPEYTTPLNPDCLNNANYRQDLRFSMNGRGLFADGSYSWPPCASPESDRELLYSIQGKRFVDVPFQFALIANMIWIGVLGLLAAGTLLGIGAPAIMVWPIFVLETTVASLLFTAITRRRYYRRWM